eukprot:SAG11_NODE_165_length_13834_cov_72.998544_6_plen_93_part_00
MDASAELKAKVEAAQVKAEHPSRSAQVVAPKRSLAGSSEDKVMPPKFVLKITCEGHTKSISSVKFSPDGKWLATACEWKLPLVQKESAAASY